MKKETTSDKLKELLSRHPLFGGKPDEWKRTSKKKNEAGHIVREFQNRASGQELVVVQLDETRFMVAQKTAKAPLSHFPSIETDPAKNKLADEALASYNAMDEASEDGTADAKAKKAGKAFANRICFAYCAMDKMMGPAWITSPAGSECHSDIHIPLEHLLPAFAGEAMENTWDLTGDPLSPLERALDLMSRGFIFDRDFQAFIDANELWLADAIEQGRAAELAAKKPAPPQP
jgi:hypothetical protein